MKTLILGAAVVVTLTGCGMNSTHQALIQGERYGTPEGLPCIRCGEDFVFIPNEPMAALRQSKRIYHFEWGDPSVAPVY